MSFLNEGALYSIVRSKCPKCNLSDLYVDNNPYHLRHLGKMKESCEFCGQRFEPETGFYQGAMYISYGLSIGITFIPGYILYMGFDVSVTALMITVFSIVILTFPALFRISRNIWLNIFVRFNPAIKKEAEKKQTGKKVQKTTEITV
jgi:hypothetical protein